MDIDDGRALAQAIVDTLREPRLFTLATLKERNMAQADPVSTTTLSLVARDELSDLVDFASALALAIAGYREREPDRGGVHGSGLEAQAMELTQRLTALLEQARGPPREPAAPERQGQKTLPSKSAEVKDRAGEDEPKPKRKQAAPAVVRPRATVSSRAARSRFRSRS
jgi:hypothetical protein